MLDLIALGETMVLFVPTGSGRLRYATQFERFIGGDASNLAIGLRRLGHRTGWISRLGDDEFGQAVLSFIRGHDVDTSQVLYDPHAPTGVYFKDQKGLGKTQVFYYRAGSAASRLAPEDLNAEYIAGARYFHLSGILPALSDTGLATTLRAVEIARQSNVQISFDVNYRPRLWDAKRAREVLAEIIGRVDVALANQEEAELLTNENDPERAARRLLQLGAPTVVIKLGQDGALAATNAVQIREPGFPVQVVDTVGAGDAFDAGFLAGQLRGLDMRTSLRVANVLGAAATTVRGDVEGFLTWDEVQELISNA